MNKQIYQPLTPSFSTSFSTGWEIMKDYFLRLFLLLLVLWLVSIPMGLAHIDHEYETAGAILLRIIGIGYFFLIYPVFDYCVSYLFVKGVRREEVDVKNVLKGFDYYLNIVLANLLLTALIGIAFLALIIPGIIVACRLAFVQYLVIDKQLGAIEAIEESWRMTRGYGWTIFGMGVVSFFIVIAGLLLLIIGIIPAIIWINASFAALYQNVLAEKEKQQETTLETSQ
ncbi:MAG: hypothetical protein ISR57_03540 [Bacteroidales bacterium]|nr:hypothetical protein [Bacteroidota bacterium]MBL6949698.1 hypothetical protein [Bacteroidales bacterium]